MQQRVARWRWGRLRYNDTEDGQSRYLAMVPTSRSRVCPEHWMRPPGRGTERLAAPTAGALRSRGCHRHRIRHLRIYRCCVGQRAGEPSDHAVFEGLRFKRHQPHYHRRLLGRIGKLSRAACARTVRGRGWRELATEERCGNLRAQSQNRRGECGTMGQTRPASATRPRAMNGCYAEGRRYWLAQCSKGKKL
jgi:hypothetical protein